MLTPTLANKRKLIVLLTISIAFIVGFIINITMNNSLFNVNLNIVPNLQKSSSDEFINFMNVVSSVFNPTLCAGYILCFFLFSYRKLQVLVFLIWFIWLSFLLAIMKTSIQQGRPNWIGGSGVQMLEWSCLTDYGCPSGHSMLAIVLLQFFVRFFARHYSTFNKYIWIFYIIVFILEILVMFSRVVLGMHSLNQVLFGLMIGMYSISLYYLYVENFLLRVSIYIATNSKRLTNLLIMYSIILLFIILEIILTLTPTYDTNQYWDEIIANHNCSHVQKFKSFQYSALQNQALTMAIFGILFSFLSMRKPQNLMKILVYQKLSIKFLSKFIITLLCGVIPAAIFLNPFWAKLDLSIVGMAFLLWGMNSVGFYTSTLSLLYFSAKINTKINLEVYIDPESFQQFSRYQVIYMVDGVNRYSVPQKKINSLYDYHELQSKLNQEKGYKSLQIYRQ